MCLLMIDAAISHIASELNQHLMRVFDINEDVVVISNILEQDGTVSTHINNKIVVSLINIEKDYLAYRHKSPANTSALATTVTSPPLYFNLYLMFSSYFSGSNYQEGLKFISNTINYFQAQNVFDKNTSSGLDKSIDKLILDVENLDFSELSNLWGVLSGKYLPSVMYKVRMVIFDAKAIKKQTPKLSKAESVMGN